MTNTQKPRPFIEYQTRTNAVLEEGQKFRGAVSCEYMPPAGGDAENFDFLCDKLRATQHEALSDAIELFYMLDTAQPPTIAFTVDRVYSVPTKGEHARAEQWLRENDHVVAEFEKEFPGARSTARPN